MMRERLASFPLFADLPDEEMDTIADAMKEVEAPIGTVLAQAGEYGYRFFVVLDGQVCVTVDDRHLTNLGAGEVFGEIALLSEVDRRTANVVATTPCVLGNMLGWDFRAAVEKLPVFAGRVQDVVAGRQGD